MTISSRRNGVICALTILGIASGLWAQVPKQKVPVPPEFAEANAALKSLDEVGPKLIQILADEKRSRAVRVQAAEWLGKLRYAPAIPTLIQYVETSGPEYGDGPTYPCRDALQMFGDAAVPSLVDAYLKANSQRSELCLYTAIARKSRPVARTYVKGLAAQNPDPEFQERIRILSNDIKPDVPR